MFLNFYLVIANNSTTIDTGEEISTDLESLDLKKLMGVSLNLKTTKF
jgi:hypothetical protein